MEDDLIRKLNKLKLKPARRTAQRVRSAELQLQQHDTRHVDPQQQQQQQQQTRMDVKEPKEVQTAFLEPRSAGAAAGRVPQEGCHPCSLCGRTFHIDALKRHAAVCQRVFQQQRKPFDSRRQRRVTDGSFDSLRSGTAVGGNTSKTTRLYKSRRKPQSTQTMSTDEIPVGPRVIKQTPSGKSWRKKSGQLRAALVAMREPPKATAMPRRSRYTLSDLNEQDAYRNNNNDDDDRVQCPYCSRKFSETAAARHIPFCRTQHQRRLITHARGGSSRSRKSGMKGEGCL